VHFLYQIKINIFPFCDRHSPETNLTSHNILMLLLLSLSIQSHRRLTIHLAGHQAPPTIDRSSDVEVPFLRVLLLTILALSLYVSPRRLHADHLTTFSFQMGRFPQHVAFLSRGGCGLPCPDRDVALSMGGRPGGAEYHHLLSFSVLTKDSTASLQSHTHESFYISHLDGTQDSGDRLS
jgi:hypothetical protein